MDLNNILTDILKLSCAGIIIVATAYYLIRPDIQKYLVLKSGLSQKDDQHQLLNLRLQAHERLLLFIERINPANMLIRLHQQGISVQQLQSVLLNEIRAEYQHNVTQQLYINPVIWNVVSRLKDDTLAMVSQAAEELPADASGISLSKKILQHVSAMAGSPYELTLAMIKKDIQQFF